MTATFSLRESFVFEQALLSAKIQVHAAAKKAGVSPVGFTIDDSYCDWGNIDTSSVVDVIDDFSALYGAHGSDNYNHVSQLLCEAIVEAFSSPESGESLPDVVGTFSLIYMDRFLDGDAKVALVGPTLHATEESAFRELSSYVSDRIASEFKQEFIEEMASSVGLDVDEDTDTDSVSGEDIKTYIAGCSKDQLKALCNWFFGGILSLDGEREAFYKIDAHSPQ